MAVPGLPAAPRKASRGRGETGMRWRQQQPVGRFSLIAWQTLQSSASDPRSTALGLMTLQSASVPSSVLGGTLTCTL